MQEKTITLTKQDIYNLFQFHEHIEDLERIVSKCDAVTDIFEEALESMCDKGIRPVDDTTIIDVVKVIHDYSEKAKYDIRELESDLSEFHTYLCNKGGERT